jgi:hypothetical protein
MAVIFSLWYVYPSGYVKLYVSVVFRQSNNSFRLQDIPLLACVLFWFSIKINIYYFGNIFDSFLTLKNLVVQIM